MNTSCLDHVLSDTERDQFGRDGFFVIENALDPEILEKSLAAVDRIDSRIRSQKNGNPEQRLNIHDCIGKEPDLLELIDLPSTFPKVWGLMGWNIYLFHTQLVVSPPAKTPPQRKERLGWHQDQNRSNGDLDMEGLPVNPMISLKVAFFLTDTTDIGVANFYIAPGQQDRKQIAFSEADPNTPINGKPVQVSAGTAVLFDRRLWHASSQNYLSHPRKVLFYGYAYRWVRPKCIMDIEEIRKSSDPIRRQLLGAATTQEGYYRPREEDVPLRTWLQKHSSEQFAWGSR